MNMVLENYHPKIIDKEAFIKYYSNNKLRKFIDDMEKICETFKGLDASKDIYKMLKPGELSVYAQGLAQKGAEYMLNLPIGKKAKSVLRKAADDLIQRNESKKGYKNTILVLEELVHGYRELFNEKYEEFIIISSLEEKYLN